MIELKSPEQIDKMRRASSILVNVLNDLNAHVKPGITTKELDDIAREAIVSSKAKCAFLGYKGFPKSICASVNEEIVHGIPSNRALIDGDIVSLDIGVEYQGFYSDAAITLAVGSIDAETKRLIDTTKQSLYRAIERIGPGARVSDISFAIQEHVEDNKFSVIRDFVGHGIGANLHEDPQIPNFGQPGMGVRLKEGMVFAIEPMVSAGKPDVEILDDGWTAVTKDKSFTAHFEHTVAVTYAGYEILTDGIM